jgi:hypothetical protein
MVLKNKSYLLIIFLIVLTLVVSAEAKIILPELLTKQAVSNIRFLSQDGKFTYYQKRSGSLLYSSNYKVKEIMTGKLGTQYTLLGTAARKKVIVMQNESFHNFYSQRSLEKIYLMDFGETTPTFIGTGSAAKLHLEDSWISYYDYYTKTLTFENTTNSALKFLIKLNNKINPYFTPQVVMSDDNTIYYTDLSENGSVGLLQFKRTLAKSEIIYKANSPMVKAEICLKENSLIMGIFGINSSKVGSTLFKAELPISDFTKRILIYKSELNDLGRLICDFPKDSVIFIKTNSAQKDSGFDVYELSTESKTLAQLSELKTVANLINMDGTLITLDNGKYLIVKGKNDYKNIDSLKSLPPNGANAAIKKMDEKLENE